MEEEGRSTHDGGVQIKVRHPPVLPPLERLDDPLPDHFMVRRQVERTDRTHLVSAPLTSRARFLLGAAARSVLAATFFLLDRVRLGLDVNGPEGRRREVAYVQGAVRPAASVRIAELFAAEGESVPCQYESRQRQDTQRKREKRETDMIPSCCGTLR